MAKFDQIESAVVSLDKQVKILTTDLQSLITMVNKQSKSQIDLANKTKAVTDATKKIDTVEKQRLALLKKLKEANSDRIQKNAELQVQLQKQNKTNKELAKDKLKLISVYERESKKLTDLRKRYKDVALTQGTASTEAKRLATQVQRLDQKLKQVDASSGQFQRNVGNYPKTLDKSKSAIKGMVKSLATLAGAYLGVQTAIRVLKGAFNTIKDFSKESAVLAGVLGKTRKETKALQDEAMRLGMIYPVMAKDVLALETAYARLGFSQKDILNLTEATTVGAIALNAELENTAALTGAVVNTFDEFETIDAPEIMDIMALATNKSALSFDKLAAGLPIVGGAANAAGVNFTQLVALMGKLADAGIDTSSSATALRNIFIESAAQGLNYNQILDKIVGSQDQLTAANDEFGKRAAVSAVTLAKNIDGVRELDTALQDAGGTAQRMADEQINTLDGAVQGLKSAYEGLVLSFKDSEGGLSSIINLFTALLRNHKFLTDVIKENFSAFSDLGTAFKELFKSLGILNEETEKGAGLMKLLGTTTKIAFLPVKLITKAFTFLVDSIKFVIEAIQFLIERFDFLRIPFEVLGKGIQFIIKQFNDFVEAIQPAIDKLKVFTKGIGDAINFIKGIIIKINKEIVKNAELTAEELLEIEKKLAADREAIAKAEAEAIAKAEAEAIAARALAAGLTVEELLEMEKKIAATKALADATAKAAAARIEQLKINKAILDEIFNLTHSETEIKLKAIEKQAEAYREAGVSEVLIAQWVALEKEKIGLDINKVLEKAEQEKLDKQFDAFEKEIERELAAYEAQIDAEWDLDEKARKAKEDADKKTKKREEGERKQRFENIATGLEMTNQLAQEVFNFQDSLRQNQLDGIERQRDAEITAAEKAGKDTSKIKDKYAKKEAAIRTKQAKADKAQALFGIALNTALGVTNALSKVVTAPLVPLILALGAIQAAAVIAKPIPKFEHGTDGMLKLATDAIVGEKGSELITTPKGDYLSPSTATKVHLPEKSQVFKHDSPETQAALSGGMSEEHYQELVNEQRLTRKAIENMKIVTYTPEYITVSNAKANNEKRYLDQFI